MIDSDNISRAQQKWLSMIEYYFPKVYSSGIITHKQLVEAHNKFLDLRATDPKFKIGWPIWLITNNAISRGVYKLPIEPAAVEDDPDKDHPYYAQYESELKQFGIVV